MKYTLSLGILCLSQLAGAQALPARFKITQYNVGGSFIGPYDINENGDMLGGFLRAGGGYDSGVKKSNGTNVIYQPLVGWNPTLGGASQINDNCEAIGSGFPTSDVSRSNAVKWNSAGVPTVLPLASTRFIPSDYGSVINELGDVAGYWSATFGGQPQWVTATWDADGNPTNHGVHSNPLHYTNSGKIFTEYGQILSDGVWSGISPIGNETFMRGMDGSETKVICWVQRSTGGQNLVMADYSGQRLATVSVPGMGFQNGQVNDSGIVAVEAGVSGPNGSTIAKYKMWSMTAGLIDLDTLLEPGSGLTVTRIYDINNNNQMVGEAKDVAGNTRYIRLDPVPEPATIFALGVGLAGLGKRRRKS